MLPYSSRPLERPENQKPPQAVLLPSAEVLRWCSSIAQFGPTQAKSRGAWFGSMIFPNSDGPDFGCFDRCYLPGASIAASDLTIDRSRVEHPEPTAFRRRPGRKLRSRTSRIVNAGRICDASKSPTIGETHTRPRPLLGSAGTRIDEDPACSIPRPSRQALALGGSDARGVILVDSCSPSSLTVRARSRRGGREGGRARHLGRFARRGPASPRDR